jgi:hypothetical protein
LRRPGSEIILSGTLIRVARLRICGDLFRLSLFQTTPPGLQLIFFLTGVNQLTVLPLGLHFTHPGFKASIRDLNLSYSPLEFIKSSPLAVQNLIPH